MCFAEDGDLFTEVGTIGTYVQRIYVRVAVGQHVVEEEGSTEARMHLNPEIHGR